MKTTEITASKEKKNEGEKREELRIDFLKENKLEIDWEKYAFMLEDEIIKKQSNQSEEFQYGWLITGDGFRLNSGEEYYNVYKKDSFFIKKEYVEKGAMYSFLIKNYI